MSGFKAAKPYAGLIYITESEMREYFTRPRYILIKQLNKALKMVGVPEELHSRIFLEVTKVDPTRESLKIIWRYIPNPEIYTLEDEKGEEDEQLRMAMPYLR